MTTYLHGMQIALWSGDYTQTTGQALVTARVVRYQPSIKWREYVYHGVALRSVASWARAVCRLWWDIAFGRVKSLYLVCSRSNGGFLRDAPALLAAWAGVRIVVHAHGSDIVELLSDRRISPLAKALYAHCEIIVPSTHLLEPLRGVTAAPIHLCENYFAGDSTNGAGNPESNTLTVLWNSNLMASKGFFDLVEAVRQIHAEGLAIRLISVGQSLADEEMSVSEAARRLDVLSTEEWFDYRGNVLPTVVVALIEEADVISLPSRYSSECQPLAVIQAMCAGKAIVVSDIPALRATLRDYPGHFVPVRSVAAIADALRNLYRRKQSAPAAFASSLEDAAAAARDRFSVRRFDRQMAAILRPGAKDGPT
ncbi:glycosyltransferase family 4 protein [Pelagibacterium sediminicola]|uniref:glycosyltransferase family 4 protein n=1 Tax=Pelagibacterium sediminicola TaxID=2248761 RepID=UPI0013005316|nr:glycosyltransferase family 4 protein [Pelagibacterium sediminicola]